MELANQIQAKNPLEDHFYMPDTSNMDVKVLNSEYSIQLDADTMKYFNLKRKPSLPIPHEEEMRKKKYRRISIHFLFLLEPIFGTDEFTDLVDYILNPAPNPPCKCRRSDALIFKETFSGNSSGDIWEFIEFVDQPNPNENCSGNSTK